MPASFTKVLSLLTLGALLSACSSGSSGGGTGSPPPPPPPASGWQSGVFTPWDGFFFRCANPRSGTDPLTGQPYRDVQGSVLDENNFLRSLSNDIYLWYDEIVDQDPGLFTSPLLYFEELKTFEEIAPGVPKDPPGFHFTVTDEEFLQEFQAGVAVDYGAQFAFPELAPPREFYVSYTEPNSPATDSGLTRGTRIMAVDGVDLVNSSANAANSVLGAFFPASIGESHVFTVQDPGSPMARDVVLTAEIVTREYVKNAQVIQTATGRVGYMTFNGHRPTAEVPLIDAVNLFNAGQGIDDLVLDVRYNGGGILDLAAQLAYMIAGPAATSGETFELQQWNDKHPTVDPVIGEAIAPVPFINVTQDWDTGSIQPGIALPTLNLSRVFILTTADSCSASEAIINGLRGIDIEVILVGGATCGKPYGFYPIPNCGNVYFTVQFQGVNAKGFGDYALGFLPSSVDDGEASVQGCTVNDDFTAQLGDPGEDMLEVALGYRDNGICVAPVSSTPGTLSKPVARSTADQITVPRSPLDTSRILWRQ